ncbi:MAG: flavodoxin family protein [Spirochaetes bacterium]|jgi:multimeric flavodoxin WrbA|nr:flavodoxin family protein [Spirochaetota bacterium]
MTQNSRVLALYGSPRRESFSGSLLENYIKKHQLNDVTYCFIKDYSILPCTGCNSCKKTGSCVIKDDMQKLYTLLTTSSLILTSAPVYFSSLPSQLKALIDRCQPLFWKQVANDPLRHGVLFLSAGSFYSAIFSSSITTIRHFYKTIGVSFDRQNSQFYYNTDTKAEKFSSFI